MEAFVNFGIKKGQAYINLKDDVKSLETKLKGLRCRKVDIESQVKNAERSGAKKRKREVENWLEEVEQIENEFRALNDRVQERGLLSNLFKSDGVAKMDERVERLMEQSQHFGELWLDDFENKGEPRVTTKLFGQMFSEGLKSISEWLVTDTISNIGIYGMGGVGKTALTKHIHNYLLEKKFKVYWITVSQEFSIKKLQDDIAKLVKNDISDADDEDTRAIKLSRALTQQQSSVLIILDDVWEEISLERIGIPLASQKCKLILTTRSLDVCKRMGCQKEFHVKTLDTIESWDLFKYTLGPDSERILRAEIKQIAKSVAEECAGLPLGIVTVAGSMRGIEDIKEWRDALEQLKACSIGHEEMERKVFPILEWSFNRLNKCQKRCFLYCALYPEDYKIDMEELVNLFIGAELMRRRDTRQSEFDQGHTILNQLVRVGLLEKTSSSGARECVQMHDLIRDMAIRITSGESVQKIKDVPRFLVKSKGVKQKEWTEDLDAVSILHMKEEIPSDMSPKCPKLSTLLFRYGNIKTIPNSFFRHMGGLKVLSLERCTDLTKLPNCVSEMVNLTALNLQDCQKLEHVPPLGKLKQLRELNLSRSRIKHLPEGLKELINLESLEMVRTNLEEKIIPKGTLSELHRLKQLKLLEGVQVCDPEVLNQLDVFHGHLSFTEICEPFKISRWPKHYALTLSVQRCCSMYSNWDAKDKRLVFDGCNFGRGLDAASLPKDIQYLEFNGCVVEQSDVVFQILNSSNDLLDLKINSLEGVEFLLKASSPPPLDSELIGIPYGPLPNLKSLSLEDLPDLVGLFDYKLPLPPGTFSSLEVVQIERCHKMRKLFTVQLLQSLKNLENLDVSDCKEVEEIIGADEEDARGSASTSSGPTNTLRKLPLPPGTFSSLEIISISKCDKMRKLFTVQLLQSLKYLEELNVTDCEELEEIIGADEEEARGSGPTNTLTIPPISELYLSGLPRLKNICKATIIRNSIKKITVIKCPNVKRLPLFLPINDGQPSPGTFLTLHLEDLPDFLGFFDYKLPLPPGTFSSLEVVKIEGCHKLRKLFTVQLLQSLKYLRELEVENCEEVEEIIAADEEEARGSPSTSSGPTNSTLTLPQLSELSLWGLPRLKNICKATIICNSILQITVGDCPNLKRLPLFLPINDGQPSPPITLYLGNLPDFLGFFDNHLLLRDVRISGCDKLRQLFTVQLLQSLKNLKNLDVSDCKEVEEIIGTDEEDARGSPSTSSGPTNTLRKLPLPPGTFSSLEFTSISGCDKMRKLFTVQLLQSLKNLQSLSVINCQGVEEIIAADEEEARGSPSTSSGPTNILRKLPLPPGTFSSLKFISISRCDKMTKLFTVQLLQHLKNLKKLDVSDCKEVEEIIGADEEEARGSGPTNTLTLPQISELYLSELPRLKNICKATIICNSIEYISVWDCPNVRRLRLFLPINGGQPSPPNTLLEIHGEKEWWESLEWDDPNDKIILHPFFKEW